MSIFAVMIDNILPTLAVSVIVLLVAVLFMAFKPLFTKNGRFPNIHIGGNKALKERGINCATSQDREAQESVKKEKNGNKEQKQPQ